MTLASAVATPPLWAVGEYRVPAVEPLWPKLSEAALIGPAGTFVRAVAEGNEADEAGLLLAFLSCAGASFGSACKLHVGRRKYPARIFAVLVSNTPAHRAAGLEYVRDIFERAAEHRELRGKNDALTIVEETVGRADDFVNIVAAYRDEQEAGPRLVAASDHKEQRQLVAINDFSGTLKAAQRSNSPLEPMLASAWTSQDFNLIDGRRRRKPVSAHVCLLGHAQLSDLRRAGSTHRSLSGLYSQILFTLVQRRKGVARANPVSDRQLTGLIDELANSIASAQKQEH
ncbi:MAG: hypothetical protein L0177_16360, partial [Chloroflexi bacterium]|nr:hypothetical protein [Chloroflexota bacterium]